MQKQKEEKMAIWAEVKDKDIALDLILTGYKGDVESMPVYDTVMSKLNNKGSILDFGCGAGRNIAHLKNHYERVYGYDYPNMLEFVSRETREADNVYLSSDWDYISSLYWDEILYSLVLQHIHPEEMRHILTRLASRCSRHVIHSRTWVDYTFEDILPILKEFFDIDMIEYYQDPNSDRNDHFIGVFIPKE